VFFDFLLKLGVPKMAPRMKEEQIKDVSNVFKKHKIDGPGPSVRFETRSCVQGVPKIFVRSNFDMLEEVFETVSNIGKLDIFQNWEGSRCFWTFY
jgi:hypothetical protein